MSSLALVLATLALPQDAGGTPGLILERRVRIVSRDLVNQASEIHRRETVKIAGGRVAVEDRTFGTRLVIRPDRKLAWVIDAPAGTYSEVTFDAVAARRKAILQDLADARGRVPGTADAEEIDAVLIGLGAFPAPPQVEVRDTGKNENVAGRTCVGRELVIGGDMHYIDVVVDPELADGLAYFEALSAIGGFHPAVAEQLKRFGGFPLKGTVRYALFLDRIVSQEEVLSVRRGPLPAADFEVPPNLKKVPLRGFDPDAGPRPEKPTSLQATFREDDIDRENNPLREREEPKKE